MFAPFFTSSLISLLISFFFLAFYLLDSSFLVECNPAASALPHSLRAERERHLKTMGEERWRRRKKRGHFGASSTCSSFREHALYILNRALFFCCIPDSRYTSAVYVSSGVYTPTDRGQAYRSKSAFHRAKKWAFCLMKRLSFQFFSLVA